RTLVAPPRRRLLVALHRGREAFGAGSGLTAHLVEGLPARLAVRVGRRRGSVLLRAAHPQRALAGDLGGDARRAARRQARPRGLARLFARQLIPVALGNLI